jgi:hypothetical protein
MDGLISGFEWDYAEDAFYGQLGVNTRKSEQFINV